LVVDDVADRPDLSLRDEVAGRGVIELEDALLVLDAARAIGAAVGPAVEPLVGTRDARADATGRRGTRRREPGRVHHHDRALVDGRRPLLRRKAAAGLFAERIGEPACGSSSHGLAPVLDGYGLRPGTTSCAARRGSPAGA